MLFIDFETTSEIKVQDVGAQAYARHPSTKILCMAYAFEDGPVSVWMPHYQPFPRSIREHIAGGGKVSAWNVAFERAIFEAKELPDSRLQVDPSQWVCTMAKAAAVGLPASLKEAAKAVGEVEKDEEGARAMRQLADRKRLEAMDPDKRYDVLMTHVRTDIAFRNNFHKGQFPGCGSYISYLCPRGLSNKWLPSGLNSIPSAQ